MGRNSTEAWVWPSVALTAASGLIGYGLLPFTGMASAPGLVSIVYWWAFIMALAAVFGGYRAYIRKLDAAGLAVLLVGCWLFALNLTFFGVIKPQLGQLVAFTADPLLADADKMLFGADPWRLLGWFHHPGMAQAYHQGWFIWVGSVFIWVVLRPASPEKSRLLLAYFGLWSVFGPLVHLALPAAGPVFYDELGLGERFAGLVQSAQSQEVAAYLWDGYIYRQFNPAGGISAMPSLHLATMCWSIIALRETRGFVPAIVLTIYILIASVAIGWHYAVDGIAGGIGALACWIVARPLLVLRDRRPRPVVHQGTE